MIDAGIEMFGAFIASSELRRSVLVKPELEKRLADAEHELRMDLCDYCGQLFSYALEGGDHCEKCGKEYCGTCTTHETCEECRRCHRHCDCSDQAAE